MIRKNKFADNVAWIVGGQILHAVLSFLINIIAARIFGDEKYGIINYVSSIITLGTAIAYLGYGGIIMKKFADDPENSNKYIWSGIVLRCIVSVIAIIVLQVVIRITHPDDTQRHILTLINSMSLLFNAFELLIYWFRYEMHANVIAIIRIIALLCSAVIKLLGIFAFDSLYVYMAGIVSETLFFAVFAVYAYIKYVKKHKPDFSFKAAFDMLKISYPFIISTLMISIYGQTDKLMLESMLENGDSAVGLYSASVAIAGLIAILPTSVIEGFRPEIMKYRSINEELYKRRFRQVYSIIIWTCLLYGIFVTLFAKQIILIIYSETYLGAISSLSIIVWYTAFSYIGSVNNIFLVCEGKEKYVQLITFIGVIFNIGLNYLLIKPFGIAGAAVASLCTQIITNFAMPCLLKFMRPTVRFMIEGVLFRDTFTKEEIMSCKNRIINIKNKLIKH